MSNILLQNCLSQPFQEIDMGIMEKELPGQYQHHRAHPLQTKIKGALAWIELFIKRRQDVATLSDHYDINKQCNYKRSARREFVGIEKHENNQFNFQLSTDPVSSKSLALNPFLHPYYCIWAFPHAASHPSKSAGNWVDTKKFHTTYYINDLTDELSSLTQLTTVAWAGVGRKPAANSSDCIEVKTLKRNSHIIIVNSNAS